jgi:biotin transporter BioY
MKKIKDILKNTYLAKYSSILGIILLLVLLYFNVSSEILLVVIPFLLGDLFKEKKNDSNKEENLL